MKRCWMLLMVVALLVGCAKHDPLAIPIYPGATADAKRTQQADKMASQAYTLPSGAYDEAVEWYAQRLSGYERSTFMEHGGTGTLFTYNEGESHDPRQPGAKVVVVQAPDKSCSLFIFTQHPR
ncbi:MAG: hypothetical protein ACYCW6_11060 [Candidatus Xenobia bacterium]